MNQTRFQPLNDTCKKLGSSLCNTALSIQTTDYTVTAAWTCLIQRAAKTAADFEMYASVTETTLFPVLHQYEPALVAILRDEQQQQMQYLQALSTLFLSMQAATDKQKSMLFSNKLIYRFDEFVASALQQINEHERMINEVLWRYYDNEELIQVAVSFLLTPAAHGAKKRASTSVYSYKNIVMPSTTHTYKPRIISKNFKQPRASAELALAM